MPRSLKDRRTAKVRPDDARYAARGVAWSDLATPWFIGHRGGRMLGPEETLELYRICAGAGFAIEQDVQHLVDGTVVPMHDTTIDRTMTTTGTIANMSPPQWVNLLAKASAIPGGAGAWTNVAKPPFMSQVISEFGNKQVLVPQINYLADGTRVMDILDAARVNKRSVILQSGSSNSIAAAIVARGYTVARTPITTPPSADFAYCVANGIQWVEGDRTVWTQADVDAAHAAGLKVMMFTANRRSDVAAFANIDSWFSDDPWYASGQTQFERTTDAFAGGSWIPGMFGSESTDASTNGRGQFYSDGSWGMDLSGSSTNMCGHFYLAPPDPSNYVFTFNAQHDALNGGDTTRSIYVYLGQTDKYWNDQAPATTTNDGPQGYVLVLRGDGFAQIFRKDYSLHTSTSLGAAAAIGSAPTLGTLYGYKITVAANLLKVERTDAGATTPYSSTNAAFRSLRYIHLGRAGAGFRMKNLLVA